MARKPALFTLLLRSPWWLSLLIAAMLFIGARLFLPDLIAASAALPFAAMAAFAGWRQWRTPGDAAVAEQLAELRALPWEDFSASLEAAFRRDGYEVVPLRQAGADYDLIKGGRHTLVSCRRWKVAQTGVAPLRELLAAKASRDAGDCIYVAACEFSRNAAELAEANAVRLLSGAALAALVRRGKLKKS